MSPKDIEQLAENLVAEKIDGGEVVRMQWAVQEILNNFPEVQGGDLDFYLLCARETTTRIVKKVIDLYDKPGIDGEQMLLDGYEFLRAAYSVPRDGERQVVPIYLIDDRDLLERAAEFEKQADSLRRHATELRQYVEKRRLQLADATSAAV